VDIVWGGPGTNDAVDYTSEGAGVHVDLENNTVRDGFGSHDTITGVEVVIATNFNDTVWGDSENNTIYGGATTGVNTGADTLWGGDGNDTVYGGDGVDTVRGGFGSDVL